ncbi:8422_t:CDS:2 [Paraglomus occultum]|uniref:8422_t:CDS:1 n=1 Tax=Paraglomus occultum TaxID=144539 RepID=A0A9N8ZG00_9GLOM|nr:8422_t:CDS:2 [Paraglomus occultum]
MPLSLLLDSPSRGLRLNPGFTLASELLAMNGKNIANKTATTPFTILCTPDIGLWEGSRDSQDFLFLAVSLEMGTCPEANPSTAELDVR